MTCPKCNAEMNVKIIDDQNHGEMNLLICNGPVPHTQTFGQPMKDIFAFRARVSRILEASA